MVEKMLIINNAENCAGVLMRIAITCSQIKIKNLLLV